MRKRKGEVREGEGGEELPAWEQQDEQTDIVDKVPLVEQSPTLPSVVEEDAPHVPAPQCFRVVNGGNILHRGVLTALKPGKVIDPRHYNVDQVRDSGIQLEPIE